MGGRIAGANVARMSLQWSALPPAVATAFRAVSAALPGWGFYLAGGTALALRLGHRLSVDLDLFSATWNDVEALATRLKDALPSFRVTSVAPGTLYGTLGEVQVSFFAYPYPVLCMAQSPEPGLLPLADLNDIAAMKLAAVASRGSRKDFIDLWFLAKAGISIEAALESYATKFGTRDTGHILRSLTWFDDAELEPEAQLLRPVPWSRVKADTLAWVEALVSPP